MTLASVESDPRVALVLPGGARLTHAELARRVRRVAAVLGESGVHPGARVAFRATTRAPTLFAMLAALDLGATIVPLHPRLVAAEADLLVRASGSVRTFADADLDALLAAALDPARPEPHDPGAPAAMTGSGAPLAILFTSGTTGRPKGAVLSRAAFRASADGSAKNLPWRAGDRWLLAMPLCHVGGLSVVTRTLSAGCGVVVQERFDADAVLASIDRDGVTLLSVVPTMLRRLLDADRANVLARARALLVGGAACPPSLLEECARRGVLALTTYGLTEACSQVTTQRPRDPHATEPGSGHPLAGTELRIVDGRIHVRGRTMMDGYLGEPPLDPAAWFDTGDLGEIDDAGRLHVFARRVDLVVSGGENVYPAEVEGALESCRGVRRALVFGVPDDEWGEIVACAVEKEPAREVDEAELYAEICQRLAPHKRPRRVVFTDALPTTGDKLDRAGGRTLFSPRVRPWRAR